MPVQAATKQNDVYITGIGAYSPGNPVPFDKIEDVLGRITDAPPKVLAWIDRMRPIMQQMLGLKQCYYAIDPVTRQPTDDNVSMCSKVARMAMEQAGITPAEVDLLVFAGIVMENICPPTTVLIQEELKIPCCAEYSIHSNCTSIYKAIQLAADQIRLGRYRTALIMTSQLSSPFLMSEFFNQKILDKSQILLRWFLCDGAGALVLTSNPDARNKSFRVVDTYIDSRGLGMGPDMYCLVGGHRSNPLQIFEHGWHHLSQNFDKVAKLGPELAVKALAGMVAKTGLDMNTVSYMLVNVPTKHLNDWAIESIEKDWHVPHVKFYTRLSETGYPGPCAIVQALDGFLRDTRLKKGEIVISMVAESSKWMYGGFILEYVGESAPPAK